jgi:cardiolipin synthase
MTVPRSVRICTDPGCLVAQLGLRLQSGTQENLSLKLLIQPRDGVQPLLNAIKGARKSIDILIFRLDWKELEDALKAASRKGIAVRALIAHTNRGGESKLRSLEMRFLEAGVTVARTADDLIRYHGKMMIVDQRTLYLLSFNYLHIDIEHSRGFGIVTRNARAVQDALRLFEADTNRQEYKPNGTSSLVVSPVNAREKLAAFMDKAQKQLLIYDPKVADRQMLAIIVERAKAGVDVRIIGSIASRNSTLKVAPLANMRLHTRTIIRDGRAAFIGSQSLRPPELDSRREVGITVVDSKILSELVSTFEKDWEATGFDEIDSVLEGKEDPKSDAAEALARHMSPLVNTVKQAVRKVVSNVGPDALED